VQNKKIAFDISIQLREMTDNFYYIALSMINGIGTVTAKTLISYCGGVADVFAKSKPQLEKIAGIGPKTAESIANHNVFEKAEKEMEFIEKYGINIIPYTHQNYPKRLHHCTDAPLLLYQKGETDLNKKKVISIVGTRKATHYGKSFVQQLLEELKGTEILIVSGMALGIDGQAHKSAVDNQLNTVGVLGHSLNMIYPPTHKNLAKEMLENNSSLLTEYNTHDTMVPANFPKRNRIIAGMADAVIVVESDIKGGSVITANIANTYNRDVFALPGKVKDKYSSGCNFLIKTYKAHLIESATDLLYQMGWEQEKKSPVKKQKELMLELSKDEKTIVTLLQESESMDTDMILLKSSMTGSKLAATLLELELKGIIHSLPGNSYTLS
jgi:DNA processing protein